ncbi:MAG: hypothetical protein H0X36_08780 [Sphingomonadaceae bacterium]|nr:hypothetical protein [Sphingomonadaceae bacterium]
MSIDHVQRARAAWPFLVDRASNGLPPYTYREICTEIGLHWRSAQYFLGVIQRNCRANGLPPLQFLAVNAATRLPGRGCHGSPETHPALQSALRAIYAHQWPTAAPF